jgi:hypothetical protein
VLNLKRKLVVLGAFFLGSIVVLGSREALRPGLNQTFRLECAEGSFLIANDDLPNGKQIGNLTVDCSNQPRLVFAVKTNTLPSGLKPPRTSSFTNLRLHLIADQGDLWTAARFSIEEKPTRQP